MLSKTLVESGVLLLGGGCVNYD